MPTQQQFCMRRRTRCVTVSLLALMSLLLALWHPAPAYADGVVSDCTFLGLATAMNSGSGNISFNCGGPATITLTQAGGLNVDAGFFYSIDGGNVITLSGLDTYRLFNVKSGGALTLSNIILSNGAALGDQVVFPSQGGALLNDGGVLVLNHATVRDSQSTNAGGAIENASGTTTLVDSLIENNQSKFGGGIDSLGTLTLIHSTVRGNTALDAGGGLDISGTVVIDNSQIVGNKANGALANGGGIDSQGTLEITNSTLSGNSSGQNGGGLFNGGTATLMLSNTTLSGNSANYGGGLFNGGTATLSNVMLSGNLATVVLGAGGGIENFGPLSITHSSLSGNQARIYGGGIDNAGTAPLTLVNTTLSGNSAVEGGGIWNSALTTLSNVTLSGNTAGADGGGIFNHGTANVYNATIVFNQADSDNDAAGTGGGVYNYAATTVNLRNSLVAGNRQGNATNDCAGTLRSFGRNLLYVAIGCTPVNQLGGSWSFLSTLASIGSLQNNGGPTLTHMPRLGSEIIDGGDAAAGCIGPSGALMLLDQRGKTRTIDGDGNASAICDTGAVERQLTDTDLAPRLYLPLIMR